MAAQARAWIALVIASGFVSLASAQVVNLRENECARARQYLRGHTTASLSFTTSQIASMSCSDVLRYARAFGFRTAVEIDRASEQQELDRQRRDHELRRQQEHERRLQERVRKMQEESRRVDEALKAQNELIMSSVQQVAGGLHTSAQSLSSGPYSPISYTQTAVGNAAGSAPFGDFGSAYISGDLGQSTNDLLAGGGAYTQAPAAGGHGWTTDFRDDYARYTPDPARAFALGRNDWTPTQAQFAEAGWAGWEHVPWVQDLVRSTVAPPSVTNPQPHIVDLRGEYSRGARASHPAEWPHRNSGVVSPPPRALQQDQLRIEEQTRLREERRRIAARHAEQDRLDQKAAEWLQGMAKLRLPGYAGVPSGEYPVARWLTGVAFRQRGITPDDLMRFDGSRSAGLSRFDEAERAAGLGRFDHPAPAIPAKRVEEPQLDRFDR